MLGGVRLSFSHRCPVHTVCVCHSWHQVRSACCGPASVWRSSAFPWQMVLCRLLLPICTSGIAHHQLRQCAVTEEQWCIPAGDLVLPGQSWDRSQGLSTRLEAVFKALSTGSCLQSRPSIQARIKILLKVQECSRLLHGHYLQISADGCCQSRRNTYKLRQSNQLILISLQLAMTCLRTVRKR